MGKKRANEITYLLCSCNRKKDVEVYSPNTFGMETWGDFYRQESLVFKKKYWYIETWHSGGEWEDDYTYEYRLNVILRTKNLSALLRYVEKNYPHCLTYITNECNKIIRDDTSFIEWIDANQQKRSVKR